MLGGADTRPQTPTRMSAWVCVSHSLPKKDVSGPLDLEEYLIQEALTQGDLARSFSASKEMWLGGIMGS